ncbi:ketoacyl-ACP synthase III family protein [Photorhabdus luminescens]|uniref:3-oxoacyl-ACP synthase n=2 Tax=Photorhabdus luminescens TaxID=29488 RepID=A0A5C4REJ4_PHOLU|nr:ketoacyl-ACP synthase III family protein [Photorhabdus luminescens]TDB45500.1 3-oxoacyl-ACP synthase [Photorhabdus luminescens subsp. mexicana]TNH42410.1 3-oxoacyl-ACP synthase [Photorhabdus luminescens subsp. sonorensis]
MMTLETLASYVPQKRLEVEREYQRLGLTQNEARVFSRIYELSHCPVEEGSEEEMLLKPCKELFQQAPHIKQEVVLLVYAHTGTISGVWGQNMASLLVRRLQLPNAVAIGTSSNNCVSIFSALSLAKHYLQNALPNSKALIVVGEIADSFELRIVPNVAVIGDAAAATLLSLNGKGPSILAHSIHNYPGYSQGIWLPTNSDAYRDFAANYQLRLQSVIQDVLRQADITMDEISYIIPHNVNILIWRRAAEFMNIPIEKIFLKNISETAHCFGADMLINLHSLKNSEELHSGDKVLLISAGVGGLFGASLLLYS